MNMQNTTIKLIADITQGIENEKIQRIVNDYVKFHYKYHFFYVKNVNNLGINLYCVTPIWDDNENLIDTEIQLDLQNWDDSDLSFHIKFYVSDLDNESFDDKWNEELDVELNKLNIDNIDHFSKKNMYFRDNLINLISQIKNLRVNSFFIHITDAEKISDFLLNNRIIIDESIPYFMEDNSVSVINHLSTQTKILSQNELYNLGKMVDKYKNEEKEHELFVNLQKKYEK